LSENRISNSHELNNTDHTTGKNNYNAISNNGSPEFKTVGNSKKGFLEKTLSDRKSDIKKFIENNQVLKLTKNPILMEMRKNQKPVRNQISKLKYQIQKTLLARDHLALYMMRKLLNLVMLIRIKKKII
jgi:hypothetical protein